MWFLILIKWDTLAALYAGQINKFENSTISSNQYKFLNIDLSSKLKQKKLLKKPSQI